MSRFLSQYSLEFSIYYYYLWSFLVILMHHIISCSHNQDNAIRYETGPSFIAGIGAAAVVIAHRFTVTSVLSVNEPPKADDQLL